MWLLLIGQPLVLVCKPLSFFHFEVGGTWAHSKKNISPPLTHPMSFVSSNNIMCIKFFVTRLLPVDIFQITITEDGGTGAFLAYSFKS